jgi:hypothetical protein
MLHLLATTAQRIDIHLRQANVLYFAIYPNRANSTLPTDACLRCMAKIVAGRNLTMSKPPTLSRNFCHTPPSGPRCAEVVEDAQKYPLSTFAHLQ